MGNFYIDDSVHEEAGFILCACVYTEADIDALMTEHFQKYGLNPGIFEYKSSANYCKQPELIELRTEVKVLAQRYCRYGLVVLPRDKRNLVGEECLKGVRQFIQSNSCIENQVGIFMDQGMFSSAAKADEVFRATQIAGATLYPEQNSLKIRGIQVADLISHMASIQLKCDMGLIKKIVKVEENSGYEPDMDIELGLEMMWTLRYSIFNEGNPNEPTGDQFRDANMVVGRAGLYISEYCSKDFSGWARASFGHIYLGCIH